MSKRITHEEVDRISAEPRRAAGRPSDVDAWTMDKLTKIAHLLVDIRDELARPPDTIVMEASPAKIPIFEESDEYPPLMDNEQISRVCCSHCRGQHYLPGQDGVDCIDFDHGNGKAPTPILDHVHVHFNDGRGLLLERDHCEVMITAFPKPLR